MKVKATKAYQEGQIPDKELGFVPVEGYEWEVDEERFKILSDASKNGYGKVFVKEVKEVKETAVKKEIKKRNAKK